MKTPLNRQLILLRHAQANSHLCIEDKERSLTEKGLKQAEQIASVLAQHDVSDHTVYVSPSKRTLQTAQVVCQHLALPTRQIEVVAEIYEATTKAIFTVLENTPDRIRKVVLIGHNPALTEVLISLTAPQQVASDMLNFRPASAAILTIEGSWSDLQHAPITLDNMIHIDL